MIPPIKYNKWRFGILVVLVFALFFLVGLFRAYSLFAYQQRLEMRLKKFTVVLVLACFISVYALKTRSRRC